MNHLISMLYKISFTHDTQRLIISDAVFIIDPKNLSKTKST